MIQEMKNSIINTLALFTVVLAVFISCESEVYQTDTIKLELAVEAPQVKSFFSSEESQVKWGTDDIISVVDDKGEIHVSEPLAMSVSEQAIFEFQNWPSDSRPVYVIHSGAYANNKPSDTFKDGAFYTSVESEQIISRKNSFPRASLVAVGNTAPVPI